MPQRHKCPLDVKARIAKVLATQLAECDVVINCTFARSDFALAQGYESYDDLLAAYREMRRQAEALGMRYAEVRYDVEAFQAWLAGEGLVMPTDPVIFSQLRSEWAGQVFRQSIGYEQLAPVKREIIWDDQ